MPFTKLADVELDLFWVLNPDPAELERATADTLPTSHPLKPGLPILVFIHAAGGSVLNWTRQFSDPRLQRQYNLFAIDCPMHGFSRSTEREEHTLEDSADCVVRVLDELQFPEYSIYGEGPHGVNIAAWIAAKRVDRVQSLVLATPGAPGVKASLQEIEEAMFVNKNGGGDGTGSFPQDALSEILIYCVGSSERMGALREQMGKYFEERYGAGKPAYEFRFLFTFVYNRKPIPAADLARVSCPVLFLRGGADPIICPEDACEEWTKTVADAPNVLSLAEAGIVNRLLAQFLERALAESRF
ncbi:hypothetical protein JCM10450v2_003206 [Rhodotorula kratochvilovae]